MDKIAFVFSGQGDQYAGMGKEFSEKYPAAASVYSLCDRIRPGTSALCFEGPEEALKETKNTQPCLFATELKKSVCPMRLPGFRSERFLRRRFPVFLIGKPVFGLSADAEN